MKRILLSIALLFGAMTMVAADADAQRMGKRGSFGRQSNNVTQRHLRRHRARLRRIQPQRQNLEHRMAAPIPPKKPGLPWKALSVA